MGKPRAHPLGAILQHSHLRIRTTQLPHKLPPHATRPSLALHLAPPVRHKRHLTLLREHVGALERAHRAGEPARDAAHRHRQRRGSEEGDGAHEG